MVNSSHINSPVRYWKNGWHFGKLIRIEKLDAVIKHPTKVKEVKVKLIDCEPYGETNSMTTFDELFKAAETAGFAKQTASQTDEEYITNLIRTVWGVDTSVWESLSEQTQVWFNGAVDYVNQKKTPPLPPGFVSIHSPIPAPPQKPQPEVMKGATAMEALSAPSRFQANKPSPAGKKRKATGVIEALRRVVITHPEWDTRTVYDYLKSNGFPDAKIDTISVDGGNIRRVIELAKELGYWKDKNEEAATTKTEQPVSEGVAASPEGQSGEAPEARSA